MAIFARVVDAGSFSAAAADLGLSKSAVSKAVARLEDRLGSRLLNRTTRKLSLTEAGALYYDGCRRMLSEAETADQAVTRLATAPRGRLRVNAPMSFGTLHVAPCLPDFLARFPDLDIDLTLEDRPVDLVKEGYDLAVRIGSLPDSSLVAQRLGPNRRLLCAAPGYLAEQGAPARPEALVDHACLIYSYASEGPLWRFRSAEGEVQLRLSGRLRINNGDALRAAALAGGGIALLPSFLVGDDLRAGRLLRVLPDWQDAYEAAIHAVYPASRNLSPKVRAFVDFLAERFGRAELYWDEGLLP